MCIEELPCFSLSNSCISQGKKSDPAENQDACIKLNVFSDQMVTNFLQVRLVFLESGEAVRVQSPRASGSVERFF